MRFFDDAAADEVVVFLLVGEGIHTGSEAVEFHREFDCARIDRLVFKEWIDAGLRGDFRLVDGDFHREVAVAKHASAVRPAFVFGSGGFFVFA